VRFLFSNCVYIGIKRQRRGGGNTNDRNNMNVVYNNKKTNLIKGDISIVGNEFCYVL
jgi:hypothetical protein